MSKQLQCDISNLLDQMGQDTPSAVPTEEVQVEMAMEVDTETGMPTLHVFLVDSEEAEEEEHNIIEGSLDQEEIAPSDEAKSLPHFSPLWIRALYWLGCIVMIGPAILVPIFPPAFALPVTVVIQPTMKRVGLETTLTLPGRELTALTLAQSKTVRTTGKGYQEARVASGTVTLYNALPTPQHVPLGTIITGASRVEVMLDQGVTIPGAIAPTMGVATVTAHTLSIGSNENIPAFDINSPCCVAYILAKNTTAFTGGQDARSFPMVAVRDIDQTAQQLQTSLKKIMQAALASHLRKGEAMISPGCQSKLTHDHNVGEETEWIYITVEISCTAVFYRINVLYQIVEQKLSQEATKLLGDNYRLTGGVELDVLQGSQEETWVALKITASGRYSSQFGQGQIDRFKNAIAGKSKAEASTFSLKEPGVSGVSLPVEEGTLLPANPNQINLVIRQIQTVGWTYSESKRQNPG